MLIVNNIKIAIRNAFRNKLFTLINISGLALGLACCLVIVLYVSQELSYDKYHENAKNIYRVGLDAKINETQMKLPASQAPLGPTLLEEYPNIINYLRIRNEGEQVVKIDNRKYSIDKILGVDSTFFDFFTLKFLAGNKKALTKPNSVVITKDIAEKYFKSVPNAMGKTINLLGKDSNISAVVDNSPYNTHIKFSILFSHMNKSWITRGNWGSDGMMTYIQVKEGTNSKELEKEIQGVVTKHVLPVFKKWLQMDLVLPNYYRYYIMPLTDIHLHSQTINEFEENGNIMYVNMFIIIAIFILLIACINFSNLSTAKASTRAREIGVKKALGSGRKRIMAQFFSESIFICLISFILALAIVETCLPYINSVIGVELLSTFYSDYTVMLIFIGIAIITGLISGLYSAVYLSSFNPVKILKGELTTGKKNAKFRGALVIFQFAISIFLIISTLIVNKQLTYINNKDLGYKKENFIKIDNADLIKNRDIFSQKLMELPGVKGITFASDLPGKFCNGSMMSKCNCDDKNAYSVRVLACDDNYVKTMKSELVEGRFFSRKLASDSLAIVINEAAVKEFGLTNPIGTELAFTSDKNKFKVVGVIKNIYNVSLKTKVFSQVFIPEETWYNSIDVMGIRLSDSNNAASIRQIEGVWNEFTNNTPMKHEFFTDIVKQLHVEENNNLRIFTTFSIIAIFIALIGLLGLVAFTIEQKVKEIGVRKVLGAPVASIIMRLNMDIIKWIAISFMIACPCAFFIMNKWLQDFVYRIDIGVWVFVISGLCTMLITLSAVSWQALKAARMNPVDCLRSE